MIRSLSKPSILKPGIWKKSVWKKSVWKKSVWKKSTGLLMLALLAGCGFQLRGTGSDHIDLDSINVTATNVHSEMQSVLERALTDAGVKLVSAEKAPYSVHILTEDSTRRAIATTNTVQVAQYLLKLVVQFELQNAAGKQVIAPSDVSAERTYQFDNTSLIGNSEQENLLNQEMRRDVASQIISRINATLRTAKGQGNGRVSANVNEKEKVTVKAKPK